jgi:hypothetical protein
MTDSMIALDMTCTNENDDVAMAFIKMNDNYKAEIIRRIKLTADLKKADPSLFSVSYSDYSPDFVWGAVDLFQDKFNTEDTDVMYAKAMEEIEKEDYPFRAEVPRMVAYEDSVYWTTFHKHGCGTRWETYCLYLSDLEKEVAA